MKFNDKHFRYQNVILNRSETDFCQNRYPVTQEELIAFTGAPVDSVSLQLIYSRPLSFNESKGWRALFGSWPEDGDENDALEEIYRSRSVPSGFPEK